MGSSLQGKNLLPTSSIFPVQVDPILNKQSFIQRSKQNLQKLFPFVKMCKKKKKKGGGVGKQKKMDVD